MDGPTSPSIMGAENPKFSTLERRQGQAMSDSESMDLGQSPGDPMSASMMSARKSKDGLSREERMKVVRERQLEEHKRRLDELRAAQMQAMRAKKQLDTERRRRVEEMKSKEEQRRAAVEERRRRIEDAERNRREAILRKHEEIFERIEQKRRQHESRRAAYGIQQTNGDSFNVHPSRRAISVGVLSGRGSLMSRSYHQSHTFSPGSLQSARYHTSPSTPSRAGGDRLLESVSGNSSEISPVHTGRHGKHFRITHSHPPPTQRNRAPDRPPRPPTTARTPSNPMSASFHTDGSKTERAPRRPTTLITRIRDDSDLPKLTTSRSTDTFKVMSKRSQSASNVNRKAESSPEKEVVPEDSEKAGKGKKIISEAEAKAALAEKRRLARLKVEAERRDLGTPSSRGVDESVSPSHPAEEEGKEEIRKSGRSQSIVMFEQDEARMEAARSVEDLVVTPPAEAVTATPPAETVTVVSEVQDEMPAEVVEEKPAEEVQPVVEQITDEPPMMMTMETETVVQPDVIPNQKVESRTATPPAEEEVVSPPVAPLPTATVVREDDDAERLRQETERRRLEMEQREEEERILRRQRLEAIKRLTKGAAAPTTPAERLVSPAAEKPSATDALENARKLLQRRGLGSGAESPVTTPGEPEEGKVNGIGTNGVKDALSLELDPFAPNGWTPVPDEHRHAANHVTMANSDLLLNFE